LNRDEGSYTLSHTYDQFLATSWQEPEEELNKLLLIKVSDRDRNVKVKNVGCVEVIVFLQCVKLFEVLADWTDDCFR